MVEYRNQSKEERTARDDGSGSRKTIHLLRRRRGGEERSRFWQGSFLRAAFPEGRKRKNSRRDFPAGYLPGVAVGSRS